MKASPKKFHSGFTLIELLVVVAIIGILATVVVVNLTTAQKKARDSRRKSDVGQINTAYSLLYQDTGNYYIPGTGLSGDGWGWISWLDVTQTPSTYPISIAQKLVEGGYFTGSVPHDPLFKDEGCYAGISPSSKCRYDYFQEKCSNGQGFYILSKLEISIAEDITSIKNLTCTSASMAPNTLADDNFYLFRYSQGIGK
ncbi:MAG: prepilin-type N-terminal cleavage/methylation domain-containing protein [Patescibacteria group bacterium]|jgi:prepilin-type N-terminal cleavage/methylation domain-containing protein